MPWTPKRTILNTTPDHLSDPPGFSEAGEQMGSLIEAANANPPKVDESRLLTVEEAADHLGVSKQTVRNWELSGKLKPTNRTPKGHRRYTESQVNALKKQEMAGAEAVLPGVTPAWLLETAAALLGHFKPDQKINIILHQGAADGALTITVESEDGLAQVVRKFQAKGA